MAGLAGTVGARESRLTAWRERFIARSRTNESAMTAVRWFLYALLTVYILKQLVYVVAFPPFTGHDEVAHYAYLRTVATEHRVPHLIDLAAWRAAVAAGKVPSADLLPDELYPYCRFALDWYCAPNDPQWASHPPHIVTYLGQTYPSGWQYAANHPPLYYIVMTPLYLASDQWSPATQQYLLRLAAIPFGILIVVLAYLLTRTLFPGDAFLAITVPAFVAFQPQISYEAAMVNNDIVCIALYSWVLYLLVVGLRDKFPIRTCVLLGFAFGLALLSKGTSLTAAAIIAFAMIFGLGWKRWRSWLPKGVLTAAIAGVLAAPWYAFLYHTYGNLSGLPQISRIQYWNKPAGTFFSMLTSRDFMAQRFQETWGDFGWRKIPLDNTMLWAIGLPLILAVGGLVLYALTARRNNTYSDDPVLRPARWQTWGVLTLLATCAIAYIAVIQFGTEFALTQARYYFPAVNAAALLLMLGFRTLIPRRFLPYGQTVIVAALVLMNVLIFTQYVLPHYPFWNL